MDQDCCTAHGERLDALEEFQKFFLLVLKGMAIISPIGIAFAGLIMVAMK